MKQQSRNTLKRRLSLSKVVGTEVEVMVVTGVVDDG